MGCLGVLSARKVGLGGSIADGGSCGDDLRKSMVTDSWLAKKRLHADSRGLSNRIIRTCISKGGRSMTNIVDVLEQNFLPNEHRVINPTTLRLVRNSMHKRRASTFCNHSPDIVLINISLGEIVFEELPCAVIGVFHVLVVADFAGFRAGVWVVEGNLGVEDVEGGGHFGGLRGSGRGGGDLIVGEMLTVAWSQTSLVVESVAVELEGNREK